MTSTRPPGASVRPSAAASPALSAPIECTPVEPPPPRASWSALACARWVDVHDLGVLAAANELGFATNTAGPGHGGIGPGRAAATVPGEGGNAARLRVAGTATG